MGRCGPTANRFRRNWPPSGEVFRNEDGWNIDGGGISDFLSGVCALRCAGAGDAGGATAGDASAGADTADRVATDGHAEGGAGGAAGLEAGGEAAGAGGGPADQDGDGG